MTERRPWRFADGAILAGLIALAVLATWGVLKDILEIALHSDEQSHILLAPFIVVWLIWVRRERLRFCRPGWTMLGPLAVAAGWGLSAIGFRTGVDIAYHVGALLMLGGAALTVAGTDFVKQFFPAAVAMLFLLPVPGRVRHRIAYPLQEASAWAAQAGMDLFGVPVSRAGNLLSINGHDVAVAEACNGMRMVAALGLVTFAFAFSVPMRNPVRLLLLAASPILALLVNVIRLVPTALLYGYSSTDVAEGFHDLSGWLMLFVALGLLWGILGLLRWLEFPVAPYVAGEE